MHNLLAYSVAFLEKQMLAKQHFVQKISDQGVDALLLSATGAGWWICAFNCLLALLLKSDWWLHSLAKQFSVLQVSRTFKKTISLLSFSKTEKF